MTSYLLVQGGAEDTMERVLAAAVDDFAASSKIFIHALMVSTIKDGLLHLVMYPRWYAFCDHTEWRSVQQRMLHCWI